MIYASAYTYRATLWFDLVMPSPADRKWLREKYPKHWDDMDAVWERIGERWKSVGPGADKESSVLGTALGFLRPLSVAHAGNHCASMWSGYSLLMIGAELSLL
jgi:hypothetical protein